MAFKNSLKIYLEKAFSSFAGRRFASGPRLKSAQPASHACLASPRSSPAQRHAGLPPRACPLTRRAARPTAAERARRVVAMRRRRRRASQPAYARAHAPVYSCRSRCARSLAPALLLLSASTARTRSASRRATTPAGEIRRGSSTSASNHAPAAPPRSPSSRARVCADCRAQVEPSQAPPPSAMAPPCSAAMEDTFLLFSNPA